MPIFRADFDVNSSLVFDETSGPISLDGGDGPVRIQLRNAKPNAEGHVPHLQAIVIGVSADIRAASTDLRIELANHLDSLAYVTQANIQIVQCWRVVEWEPFQRQRTLYASQSFDANYPPTPELPIECVETASAMMAARLSDHLRRALHYYRLGLLTKFSEDQFGYFWSAIETIAEGRKTAAPKPIECPKCRGPLTCEACATTPLRKPMALEAIREMLSEIVPPEHLKAVYKRLTETRHCLVHVRPIAPLEQELNQPFSNLVKEAAVIAHQFIALELPELSKPYEFILRDDYQNLEHAAGAHFTIEHDGPEEHPTDDKLVAPTITMHTRFSKTPVPTAKT